MANNTPSNNELLAWLMSLNPNQVKAMMFITSKGQVKKKMGKNTATNVIQTHRQYVINKFKGKNGQANLGRQRNRRPPNRLISSENASISRNTQEALARGLQPQPPVKKNKGSLWTVANAAFHGGALLAGPVGLGALAVRHGAPRIFSAKAGPNVTRATGAVLRAIPGGGAAIAEAGWNAIPLNKKNSAVNLGVNKFKYVSGYGNRWGYLTNLASSTKRTIRNRNLNTYKQNIKNKGLLILSNYLAEQIGYKENANTRKIDAIVKKLISLKNAVANTKSQQNKYNYGHQLGELIGDLIVAYGKLPAGSGKYRNLSNGAIAGVLDHVFNKNKSNMIRRAIVIARNQTRSNKFTAPLKVAAEHAGAVASAGLAAYTGNYNSALRGAGLHFSAPTTQNRFNLIASTQGPEAALQDWASGQLISLGTTKLKNTARYLFNTWLETHSALPGENQATFLERLMRNAKKAATNKAAIGIVAGQTAGRMARNAAAGAAASARSSAAAAGRGVAALWRGGNKPKENVYLY